MGFPTILSRSMLGPIFRNAARVRNPTTNFGEAELNRMLWQIAGMNGLVPRAFAIATVSGSVVTIARRWLSWDTDGQLPASELTITRSSAGVYPYAFASASYDDELGTAVPLVLDAVDPKPVQQSRAMVGTLNTDMRSGTLYSTDLAGAAADSSRFLVRFY